MGQTGSITSKAEIKPVFYDFTLWGKRELDGLMKRSNLELPETFALREPEFEFLMGRGQELISYEIVQLLFPLFDTDKNKMVDKFEVVCIIILLSSISNADKVSYFFDLFNFNDKGFLFDSEISLLILSITTTVQKADSKIKPPSLSLQRLIVNEAMEFAIFDPKSIRKPELITFAAEKKEVQLYLDAWRGHASQLLLAKKEMWKDNFFPATEYSITPTKEWKLEGLPGNEFFYWLRANKVGMGFGHSLSRLFTHRKEILKTIDKKIVYRGFGAIASGTLHQGLLADRWLLNAIALTIARPNCIDACFGITGQEELGRYNIRIFEGSAWRSLFLDDRIPCSLDSAPLFCKSSDNEESWPLILEKGYAKYFGSFGRIGNCSPRPDAPYMALRMLTGGHVLKYCTFDYGWKSIAQEVEGLNGEHLIRSMLAEGSIIGLGRSETRAMHVSTLQHSPRICPPHGYFNPIVGIEESEGYLYLILRDAWGKECEFNDGNPDLISGHCRLFKLKIEDVCENFDTIIVSRYPDSLRVEADILHFIPWKTFCITQPVYPLSKNPNPNSNIPSINETAKFKLKVIGGRALISSIPRSTLGGAASMKLKQYNLEKAKKDKSGDMKPKVVSHEYDFVDIAMTVSSAFDWVVAGDKSLNPKIRIRIVPTEETFHKLRDKAILEAKKKEADEKVLKAQKIAAAKYLNDNDSIGLSASVATEDKEFSDDDDDDDDDDEDPFMYERIKIVGENDSITYKKKIKAIYFKETYEICYQAEQCWLSKNLLLLPGEYHIFTDIKFSMSDRYIASLNRPLHVNDAPWIDAIDTNIAKIIIQISSTQVLEVDNLFILPVKKTSIENENNNDLALLGLGEIDDSHAEKVKLEENYLGGIVVEHDKWPFMSETQGEACSRGLINMLTRLREEACVLGAGFVAESRKYKKVQKRHVALEANKKQLILEKIRKQKLEEEKKFNASYAGQLAIKKKAKIAAQLAKNKESEDRRKGIFVENVEEKKGDNNEIMKIENNEDQDNKITENCEDVEVIDENNTNVNEIVEINIDNHENGEEGYKEVKDLTKEIIDTPVVIENNNPINTDEKVEDEISNIEVPKQERKAGISSYSSNDDNHPSESKTANLENTTEFQFEES